MIKKDDKKLIDKVDLANSKAFLETLLKKVERDLEKIDDTGTFVMKKKEG
jgi:hypothetical protein